MEEDRRARHEVVHACVALDQGVPLRHTALAPTAMTSFSGLSPEMVPTFYVLDPEACRDSVTSLIAVYLAPYVLLHDPLCGEDRRAVEAYAAAWACIPGVTPIWATVLRQATQRVQRWALGTPGLARVLALLSGTLARRVRISGDAFAQLYRGALPSLYGADSPRYKRPRPSRPPAGAPASPERPAPRGAQTILDMTNGRVYTYDHGRERVSPTPQRPPARAPQPVAPRPQGPGWRPDGLPRWRLHFLASDSLARRTHVSQLQAAPFRGR